MGKELSGLEGGSAAVCSIDASVVTSCFEFASISTRVVSSGEDNEFLGLWGCSIRVCSNDSSSAATAESTAATKELLRLSESASELIFSSGTPTSVGLVELVSKPCSRWLSSITWGSAEVDNKFVAVNGYLSVFISNSTTSWSSTGLVGSETVDSKFAGLDESSMESFFTISSDSPTSCKLSSVFPSFFSSSSFFSVYSYVRARSMKTNVAANKIPAKRKNSRYWKHSL